MIKLEYVEKVRVGAKLQYVELNNRYLFLSLTDVFKREAALWIPVFFFFF